MTCMPGAEVDAWRADFAWSADQGGPGLTVRRFRRAFELETVPESFVVFVSADSRYILWVNGERVGRGPLKGTPEHYFYEAYEIATHLQAGHNVLAADVRRFGTHTPTSEVHGPRAGFLLQGPESAGIDTPGQWKVQVDRAVQADATPYIANAHVFLGHWERVDGAAVPQGWPEAEFDDSGWEETVSTGPADIPRDWGVFPPHHLFAREVPALIEEPHRFARTIRDHAEAEHLFGESPRGWELPAGHGGEIVLDGGALTTGYPELRFSGGAGREVQIVYGEAMYQREERGAHSIPVKGIRDDLSGDVEGYRDTLVLPGGEFDWEPFHWRTFWFIKLVVSPGDGPFKLNDLTYRFTTFPQDLQAEYESSDPDAGRMMELSWRTLQLCSHETYEDCPYYEQLQYIADTRLEILASMALANETRLARRAIRLYRDSVRPDGLVHSRVPSVDRQILPYFALIWVLMIEDYWQWVGRGDADFVRSCLHVADGVLWFFRGRLREDGFVGHVPPWNMVDREDGWRVGEPPAITAGESTYLSCLYICAMDAAMRLHMQVGEPGDAERWAPVAERVREAVRSGAWSDEEGLFLEGPGRTDDRLSQHSQMMAILSDVAVPEQTHAILRRLTTDPSLLQTRFMQSYYLARALEKAGAYEQFTGHVLDRWRHMLGLHLTTWAEYIPGRSDCHAWSSWIAADFLTCVLGIRPSEPGFEEILIRPQTSAADWARGAMPTPVGMVHVSWKKDPDTGSVKLEAEAPEGVPTIIELPLATPDRFEAGGRIRIEG